MLKHIIPGFLFIAILAALGGCNGPTKAGKQARTEANDRMNVVNAQVHYDQARQSFDSAQFDKAMREINKAIARYDQAPNYYVLQGRIFLETHQLEAAVDSFKTAIEVGEKRLADEESAHKESSLIAGPQHPMTAAQREAMSSDTRSIVAEANYFMGVVYQRWSDDEHAYTNYARAFELTPTNAQYLLAAAESLIAIGDFERAQKMIEPKMSYFEHNAALRQLQGQIALLQGDPKRAASLYAEARLLSPDDDTLLEQLMWAQYAAGQYGQCFESLKRLQERANTKAAAGTSKQTGTASAARTDLLHLEARCLNMMGRTAEARERYIELTRIAPSDVSVWTELGTLAWDLGDYRRMAMCSVQIIALAPERYEGYMFKGINERQRGNMQEAIKLFQKSASQTTDIALPHLLLGQAYEQSGNPAAARAAYQEAMQAEPTSAEAKELLRRLTENQRLSAAPTE